MAGRGRIPRQAFDDGRRGYPDIREGPYLRGPPRLHPAQIEELELRTMDLRRLAADNRKLADDRDSLERNLIAARDELQRMSFAINDIQNEREMHARELFEKGLKLEADLRAAEPLKNEVMQVRADIQKLTVMKEELNSQVKTLSHELTRAQAENKQIPVLRSEIDGLRQELVHARTALEYEKKGNAELFEQRQAMEKNLVSMAREIEKLRADLASNDARPWGVGGPYGVKLGSPEGAFPSYGDAYGLRSGIADKSPLYGAGSGSWGTYEKSHVTRR